MLIKAHGSTNWLKGTELDAFVGLVIHGARLLNSSVWENRSPRLMAIALGHEVLLFTLQGAIFGVWPDGRGCGGRAAGGERRTGARPRDGLPAGKAIPRLKP